jgi:hypothetical protein
MTQRLNWRNRDSVKLHNRENNTWHIVDGGLYSCYIASGDELVELRRGRLNGLSSNVPTFHSNAQRRATDPSGASGIRKHP